MYDHFLCLKIIDEHHLKPFNAFDNSFNVSTVICLYVYRHITVHIEVTGSDFIWSVVWRQHSAWVCKWRVQPCINHPCSLQIWKWSSLWAFYGRLKFQSLLHHKKQVSGGASFSQLYRVVRRFVTHELELNSELMVYKLLRWLFLMGLGIYFWWKIYFFYFYTPSTSEGHKAVNWTVNEV